jgi:hypothetical protein
MPQLTQHEVDRKRVQYERRHFDSMSNAAVIRAMTWRNRCPLLLFSNFMTLVAVFLIVI